MNNADSLTSSNSADVSPLPKLSTSTTEVKIIQVMEAKEGDELFK